MMDNAIIPIVIGLFFGTIFLMGLLLRMQKIHYQKLFDTITESNIETVKILLKKIDKLDKKR